MSERLFSYWTCRVTMWTSFAVALFCAVTNERLAATYFVLCALFWQREAA